MKLIKEIKDKEITGKTISSVKWRIRKAARAIVFDNGGNVAIISVGDKNYHKIPGGGIEGKEDIETALRREVLEETGCKIKVVKEVGEIVEFRGEHSLEQHSYCFIAKLDGKKGETSFTKDEIKNGFRLLWVTFEDALNLFKKDSPKEYGAKFMSLRDYSFLLAAKKVL